MSEAIVDLVLYKDASSKIFTGRDRGKQVREDSDLDKKVKEFDTISVIIPNDIYSINPSFLEEFLYDAVINLGKEKFFNKFKFINDGEYKVNQDLQEAIDRILRDRNAIL